jgi:hypothetical protein
MVAMAWLSAVRSLEYLLRANPSNSPSLLSNHALCRDPSKIFIASSLLCFFTVLALFEALHCSNRGSDSRCSGEILCQAPVVPMMACGLSPAYPLLPIATGSLSGLSAFYRRAVISFPLSSVLTQARNHVFSTRTAHFPVPIHFLFAR